MEDILSTVDQMTGRNVIGVGQGGSGPQWNGLPPQYC